MTDKLTRIHLAFPPSCEDMVTMVLALHASWGWEDEGMRDGLRHLVVHSTLPEHAARLHAALSEVCPSVDVSTSSVDNADWNAAWRQFFSPLSIGRFTVVPSWLAAEHAGPWTLVIEPKMAFGTGHHATTALCLEALDALAQEGAIGPGQRFLDLGTGSGILALAASRLGLTGLALDIDSVAVDNAAENLAVNKAQGVEVRTGTITDAPTAHFHLVLANILAGPLMDMARDITARLLPGGILILSGILAGEQALAVETAYTDLGLPSPQRHTQGEWASLVFRTA
ncbi:MAG: 50S ribosomal protein L11 methyltransferase [Desulfomicrobiaceae bacterium]|jgi:ribosomal protein L11 methyltransferase|nr:50S ribosomal protein L11 methyltransferase [Desulfomicrobiaceae bacterium]